MVRKRRFPRGAALSDVQRPIPQRGRTRAVAAARRDIAVEPRRRSARRRRRPRISRGAATPRLRGHEPSGAAATTKGAKKAFETALSEMRRAHDDEATLRGDIYYVTATLNLALVELAMGHLDAAERGARWAQEALSGSDQELRATHNLALILDERGLVAEAAALYEDVHSGTTRSIGRGAPR